MQIFRVRRRARAQTLKPGRPKQEAAGEGCFLCLRQRAERERRTRKDNRAQEDGCVLEILDAHATCTCQVRITPSACRVRAWRCIYLLLQVLKCFMNSATPHSKSGSWAYITQQQCFPKINIEEGVGNGTYLLCTIGINMNQRHTKH